MKILTWGKCDECPFLVRGPEWSNTSCSMGVDRKSAGLNEIPPHCPVPDAPEPEPLTVSRKGDERWDMITV